MSIFDKRINILPYEYPDLLKYKDAIRHSYWIESEYNFTTDISDYYTKTTDVEKDVIKKTMLAIAQIEVSVKTFWADMYKRMPIAEIGDVGMTFAESEIRHKDAYAKLIKYLDKYLSGSRSGDNKMYTKSVLLFSLFIEHVSLFSQFLIMMSFNKDKNLFKGISNVVEATSKEEEIHGNFGAEIINIIKSENPEWFDEEFDNLIYSACDKAFAAECEILDWIFEKGELDFISKDQIKEFIKNRFNNSLNKINLKSIFQINTELLEPSLWFDVEISSTKEGDFFYKKSIDYNKKSKSITENDLF